MRRRLFPSVRLATADRVDCGPARTVSLSNDNHVTRSAIVLLAALRLASTEDGAFRDQPRKRIRWKLASRPFAASKHPIQDSARTAK
jgi:hypothetical protein